MAEPTLTLRRHWPTSSRARELEGVLENLVNHLRRQGYAVPVDKFVEATGIFLDECARSPEDLSRLKYRLTPLFAHGAASQRDIAQRIDAFVEEHPIFVSARSDTAKPKERSGYWVLAGIAALAAIIVAFVWFSQPAFSPPVPDTRPTIGERPPAETSPVETGIEYTRITQRDDAKPLPAFEYGRRSLVRSPISLTFIALAVSIPLVLFFLWWFLRLRGRRAWMQKADFGDEMPARLSKMFGEDGIPIENSVMRSASQLNSARIGDSGVLDLRRTVVATARRVGFLQPVFKDAGASSDYVVLVQRLGPNDHLARVSETILDRVERAGVRVRRYYYRHDPRQCRPSPDARNPMPFAELVRDFGRHRFLVIGSPEGFFHPVTGEPVQWSAAEKTFVSRALLTSRRPEDHSYQEEELVRQGYFVSVAGPTGVATYASTVSAGLDVQEQWAPPTRYGGEVQARRLGNKTEREDPPDRSLLARLGYYFKGFDLQGLIRDRRMILRGGRMDTRLALAGVLRGLRRSASPAVVAVMLVAIAALGTIAITGFTRTVETVTPSAAAALRADLEVFRDCTNCPEMIALPASAFLMGSPESDDISVSRERPQRMVTVEPFALARTEVTFDQWAACEASGGCTSNPVPDDLDWGRGERPVIRVSWLDAQEYIDWLNLQIDDSDPYRLPTEAEWEYAARAGTETRYHWGDELSRSDANYGAEECCSGKAEGTDEWVNTAPVGQFPSNAFGLHDMSGNVFEWVADCWHENYVKAPVTSFPAWEEADVGDCSLRVVRGGSWNSSPRSLRSADRLRDVPDDRSISLGFRPARTLLTP